MAYKFFVGNKKGLVFPAMCNAYLLIDYSREIAEEPHGLWGINDSFTIETILTPYDVNGFGWKTKNTNNPVDAYGVDDNYQTEKSIPSIETITARTHTASICQSERFLEYISRIDSGSSTSLNNDGYIMPIFYNTHIELYLQNTTLTSHNQPAEYQICFRVQTNPGNASTNHTVRTGPIILSRTEFSGNFEQTNDKWVSLLFRRYHDDSNSILYDNVRWISGSNAVIDVLPGTGGLSSKQFSVNGDCLEVCYPGQVLYIRSGQTFTKIGVVEAVPDANTITLEADPPTLSMPIDIYTDTVKEAPYLLNSTYISATFNNETGAMTIYIDGIEAAKAIHPNLTDVFQIDNEDCKIGQNQTLIPAPLYGRPAVYQFFGEIHEFAISNGVVRNPGSIDTLLPSHRNLLLYYRFEEDK